MALRKNGEELITLFELLVDDSSELSSAEELDLLNDSYLEICDDRPWEFLKKEFSGVTDGTTIVALDSDFNYFVEYNDLGEKVIYVDGSEYKLVNYSERRQYVDQTNIAYVNGQNLYFVVAPDSGLAVLGDYIKIPEEITLITYPIFNDSFHKMIAYKMAVSDFVLQANLSEEKSIQNNTSLFNGYLARMQYQNARITNK